MKQITTDEMYRAACANIERFLSRAGHNCSGKGRWGHEDYFSEIFTDTTAYTEAIGFSPLHDKVFLRLRLSVDVSRPYLAATRNAAMKICSNWYLGSIRVNDDGRIFFQQDFNMKDCATRANQLLSTLEDLMDSHEATRQTVRTFVIHYMAPSAERFAAMENELLRHLEENREELCAAACGLPYDPAESDKKEEMKKALREMILAKRPFLEKESAAAHAAAHALNPEEIRQRDLARRIEAIGRLAQRRLDAEAEKALAGDDESESGAADPETQDARDEQESKSAETDDFELPEFMTEDCDPDARPRFLTGGGSKSADSDDPDDPDAADADAADADADLDDADPDTAPGADAAADPDLAPGVVPKNFFDFDADDLDDDDASDADQEQKAQ